MKRALVKIIKNISLILALILLSSSVYSQKLEDRDIRKIGNFGIDLTQLDLENEEVLGDLKQIIKIDKKRKRKKIVGKILASMSILSMAGGIYTLSLPAEKPPRHSYLERGISGVFFLGSGVIEGGISIPLFLSSKRKKKERDKMIRVYNQDWSE